MNFELKDIPGKITPLLEASKRYLSLIFILFFAGVYGFLVFRIDSLASSEPDEAAVTERLQSATRPQIDEEAVEKIKQLEAQNIQVQTLFEEARQNPFAE